MTQLTAPNKIRINQDRMGQWLGAIEFENVESLTVSKKNWVVLHTKFNEGSLSGYPLMGGKSANSDHVEFLFGTVSNGVFNATGSLYVIPSDRLFNLLKSAEKRLASAA